MDWQKIENFPFPEGGLSPQFILCHVGKKWMRFGRYSKEGGCWYYSGTSERSQWSMVEGDAPTHFALFPSFPENEQ